MLRCPAEPGYGYNPSAFNRICGDTETEQQVIIQDDVIYVPYDSGVCEVMIKLEDMKALIAEYEGAN